MREMPRLCLVLFLLTAPTWAQYRDLAMTDDGSVLLFATELRTDGPGACRALDPGLRFRTDPPPAITTPFTCGFCRPGFVSARALVAAWRWAGVYQVDLEIPQAARGSDLAFCELAGTDFHNGSAGYLPVAR